MKASVKQKGKHVKKEQSGSTGTAPAAPAPAVVKVLKVKAGMKYRGAREAWYARLQQYEGKSEEEFIKSATTDPPSLTKKNEPEPPSGWIAFFKRTGVASLV
jgi:hypothetical protein